MSGYIDPDLTAHWQSAGEDTLTWILADDDGPSAVVWRAGETELAITHVETNYRTEVIRVLLTIGDGDLSLWVPLGDLIDYMPSEISAWIIANAPLTDEERPETDS